MLQYVYGFLAKFSMKIEGKVEDNQSMYNDIVIIGSTNMDLVINVKERPAAGETVLGDRLFTNPGGKGANQAYSCANVGGDIAMISAVGDDVFGEQLLHNLEKAGVHTACIKQIPNESSGVALITVDENGENSIIVAPAANREVTPALIEEYEANIKNAKAILIQLEIPFETVELSVKLAKKHDVLVFLDPAPARELPQKVLENVDYILPNETELAQITNMEVKDKNTAIEASKKLLAQGVKTVIAKLGKDGVVICSNDNEIYIPGEKVSAVDTTGAGDAFAGAFISQIVAGKTVEESVSYANIVGALTVTKVGAQAAMPTKEMVENFMKERA